MISQLDAQKALQDSKQLIQEASALTEKLFDKGQAYNNALTLVGFGGLFALLATTKTLLPP
jgi:hypothetical protein